MFVQCSDSKKDRAVIIVIDEPTLSGRAHMMVSFSCSFLRPPREYTHHVGLVVSLAAKWICVFLGLFILEVGVGVGVGMRRLNENYKSVPSHPAHFVCSWPHLGPISCRAPRLQSAKHGALQSSLPLSLRTNAVRGN